MLEQGFSFEQWVVTPADRVVSGPYGETKLEPRVMEVFVFLATHAGEVVSRHALIDEVWGGAVVGDEVLSRCIYRIRQALGESSREPRYLETVPKRGYRLAAAVVDLAEASLAELNAKRWQSGSPFRGLQVFDVEHAPVFFGRARATREALTALRQQASISKHFLLLLGASGVGKSSLARAGLLHHLTRPGAVEGIRRWRHDVFRPGSHRGGPLAALADSLSALLQSCDGQSADFREAFAAINGAQSEAIAGVLAGCLADDERIALVVDQLEEIFSDEEIDDTERDRFFDTLEALAGSGHCWIIATLRSDFYPQCVTHPALMRLKKGGGQYDVRPLRSSEIREMIRHPAIAAGLTFERDAASGQPLDEALLETAAAQPRLLPLLEFTLQALYDERTNDGRLTWSAYRALGGIEGSLARRADALFSELPEAKRAALPAVLARVVRTVNGQVSGTSRSLVDFPDEASRALVQAFVDARLFNAELDASGDPRVSVTHEALLTHWPRVRAWVAENREMIVVRERVAHARDRWDAEQRRDDLLLPRGKSLEEAQKLLESPAISLDAESRQFIERSARRARRRRSWERAAAAGLGTLTLVAGAAAWLAVEQRDLAEEQARTATATSEFLVEIFESADPSESAGGELTAKHVLDRGVARLDEGLAGQAALRTRLRALVARAYSGLGLYTDAETLLRQADREAQAVAQLGDRGRLAIRYELADVLTQRGNLGEGEALHAEVLAERRRLLGEDDVDTTQSLRARAHILWRDGAIEEAESLFVEVASNYARLLGRKHARHVDVLSELGTLKYQKGLLGEAEKYYRQAAELAPGAYGSRHIGTAIAISNLSTVETDPATRRELLEESLAIRREVLGDEHPLVSRAEQILADFFTEQGDRDRAQTLYRQALGRLARSREKTPVLPLLQNSYARFLQSGQRYGEAVHMYRASLDGFEDQLGPGHRWSQILRLNLAYAHFLNDELSAARQVLESMLATGEPRLDDYLAADARRRLAEVALAENNVTEALELAESAAAVYRRDVERYRMSLAAAHAVTAEVQLANADPAAAYSSASRALELGEGGAAADLATYRALAGYASALAGDCDNGLRLLEAGHAELQQAGNSLRMEQRAASRLEAMREQCDATARVQ